MAIPVYSEQDLRNQELLIGLAESSDPQSAANKNILDTQWSQNVIGLDNNFFIQDDSGQNLWAPDSVFAGSWYALNKWIFLDVSFTFPTNSDNQVSILGIHNNVGVPPPIPMQDALLQYPNIVFIDGVAHELTMHDDSGTVIAIWFDGATILNQDLSDKLIQFKVFYKAQ